MSEQDAVTQQKADAIAQQQANAVLRHCMMNCIVRDFAAQPEIELFKELGDAPILMASALTYSAVGELLLNPLGGALSDFWGRKIFLNSLCAYSVLGNMIMAANPFAKVGHVPFVVIHRAVTGLLSAQSGSANGTNSLADISSGTQLGSNVAKMSGAFGVGMLLGPVLGNMAFKAGGLKGMYRARAAIALSHLVHNLATCSETLKVTRPLTLTAVNPFGFLKLVWNPDFTLLSRLLRALLVCSSEQKNQINMKMLWLKDDIGLSFNQVQNAVSIYSATIVLSGQLLAKQIIERLGATCFSDLTAACNVASYTMWATTSSALAFWLGLIIHIPGVNGTGASMVKADMMSRAGELGIGKGEMNGYYATLRSFLVMFVPPALARLYVAGLPSGKGGNAWLLMSLFQLLSLGLRK